MSETSAPATPGPPEQLPPPLPAIDWPELTAGQFSLLCLPALPTDAHTGLRPLRFLRLGQAECHTPEFSLLSLDAQTPQQTAGRNRLEVRVDHRSHQVCLAEPLLVTEPPNHGLGRFLLAQGIQWAIQHWPDYQLERMALPASAVPSESDRLRRDNALQSQGFQITYEEEGLAWLDSVPVSSLNPHWNQERVQRLGLLEAAGLLEQADQLRTRQQKEVRQLGQQLDSLRHEENALRFAIGCLIVFTLFQAVLLVWMAVS